MTGENHGTETNPPAAPDPLAAFLSDPDCHFSDILYFYFRIYKKKLLWNFLLQALAALKLKASDPLFLVDVGASMGFDALYLLRKQTGNFQRPLPCASVTLSLIEGDAALVASGEESLKAALPGNSIHHRYHHRPLVEDLPLPDQSQHLAICSEVVEHLEEPEKLLREIYRVLKPGGFLMLTTDNSPNFFQRIRRIPALLAGTYRKNYARPDKAKEIVAMTRWNDRDYPIYGHINLNPTRVWENLSQNAGFEIAGYGTYESIRRGGGSRSPFILACYFAAGAAVHSLLPRRIGRFFGDTTALLLRRPGA